MVPIWPVLNLRLHDTSMVPALQPGDRLIALRWLPVRPGDIVVIRDPAYPPRLLVKRLAERTPAGYLVRADNPNVGSDSRHFGVVPRRLVLGRVVWRYAKR